MRVKAVSMGYYGHIRQRPGAVLNIKGAGEFSKKWMAPVCAESKALVEKLKKSDPKYSIPIEVRDLPIPGHRAKAAPIQQELKDEAEQDADVI